jgi:hypothetical protein
MKAFRVSKENDSLSLEEKTELVKTYSTSDLLYLLREIECEPRQYNDEIVKICLSQLYKKNIICI